MDNVTNSMFDYNGETLMPNPGESIVDSGLISEGIEKAIKGETVKSIIVPEDKMIFLPNYIIDFTGMSEMYEFQMEALDSLLCSDGDVTLYAYTVGGLAKLGTGLSSILDRILPLSISRIFDGKCKIYKDYKRGEKPKVISDKDISTMKIGL